MQCVFSEALDFTFLFELWKGQKHLFTWNSAWQARVLDEAENTIAYYLAFLLESALAFSLASFCEFCRVISFLDLLSAKTTGF